LLCAAFALWKRPVRRSLISAVRDGSRAVLQAAGCMARPWVLAAAALCLAALGHSPHSAALAAGAVSRRGAVGGAALLENAKNCIFMFQARSCLLRVRVSQQRRAACAVQSP